MNMYKIRRDPYRSILKYELMKRKWLFFWVTTDIRFSSAYDAETECFIRNKIK